MLPRVANNRRRARVQDPQRVEISIVASAMTLRPAKTNSNTMIRNTMTRRRCLGRAKGTAAGTESDGADDNYYYFNQSFNKNKLLHKWN